LTAAGHLEAPHGLRAIVARLEAGPCTVAYMGASVTAQKDGYRPRLHAALERLTSHRHTMVNAGTGALGAIAGLFLMDTLVVSHRPDVCFVEYGTSDMTGLTPPALLGPVLDAIVHRLRGVGCEPIFLHLHREASDTGAMRQMRATYGQVASHHCIPQIDVAQHVERRLRSGRFARQALFRDVVHTTPQGSGLVAEFIASNLASIPATAGPGEPRVVADACPFERSLRDAHLLTATSEQLAHPDLSTTGVLRLFYPYVRIEPGNRVCSSFAEDLLGMVVVVGPRSGVIRVHRGAEVREHQLHDRWCTYDRLGAVVFDHIVAAGSKITVEPVQDGTDLRIIGYMVSP